METFISDLSQQEFPKSEKISAQTIRPAILDIIKKEHPAFGPRGSCSITELNVYRQKYIGEYLLREIGELSSLEDTVLNSLKNKNTLVDKIEEGSERISLGQRLADKVASFGGSWTFILSFGGFLFIWILVNVLFLASKPFDPYPFIF